MKTQAANFPPMMHRHMTPVSGGQRAAGVRGHADVRGAGSGGAGTGSGGAGTGSGPGGKSNLAAQIIPVYGFGILLYILYILFKITSKGSRKPAPTRFQSLRSENAKRKITDFELMQLQQRLMETELVMETIVKTTDLRDDQPPLVSLDQEQNLLQQLTAITRVMKSNQLIKEFSPNEEREEWGKSGEQDPSEDPDLFWSHCDCYCPPPGEDQEPPGEDHGDQAPPGEDHGDQAPPGEDQEPPGEDHGDQTPPGEDHGDQTPPGEDQRDQTPPGEDHRDQTPPGKDHRDQTPPGKDHRDQTPPGDDYRDKTPPGKDQRDQAPPGEDLRGQTPPREDQSYQTPVTEQKEETSDQEPEEEQVVAEKEEESITKELDSQSIGGGPAGLQREEETAEETSHTEELQTSESPPAAAHVRRRNRRQRKKRT